MMVKGDLNILFVYNHDSSWVKDDLDSLGKHYNVEPFYYRYDKRRKDLHSLVKNSDVIYIWFASYHGLKASFLGRKYNKKIITVASGYSVADVREHSYGLASKIYTRWIPRYILKNSDVVIAVSESNKREVLNLYEHKNVIIIPHGFDVDWFKPKGKKEEMVITVGAVNKTSIRRKGIDKFVEIANSFSEIPFLVIGRVSVDVKETFKEIPENVEFTGFIPKEELLRGYQRAKVYAQFSFHEAFGCSVAEAMLCSCIPVVTDKYALPEVVGNCGFIVPYWEEKKAIDAIKKALETSMQLGKEARKRITENFSMQNREKNLVKVIEELE